MKRAKLIKKCLLSGIIAAILGTTLSAGHFLDDEDRFSRAFTVTPSTDPLTRTVDETDTAWGG